MQKQNHFYEPSLKEFSHTVYSNNQIQKICHLWQDTLSANINCVLASSYYALRYQRINTATWSKISTLLKSSNAFLIALRQSRRKYKTSHQHHVSDKWQKTYQQLLDVELSIEYRQQQLISAFLMYDNRPTNYFIKPIEHNLKTYFNSIDIKTTAIPDLSIYHNTIRSLSDNILCGENFNNADSEKK